MSKERTFYLTTLVLYCNPNLPLADAIRQGALVHYLYYPVLVELTEAETAAYAKLTKRIGWALMDEENEKIENNDTLTSLLMQRSRLIGAAANKLNALRQLMVKRLDTSHTLFYCGDGSIEGAVTEESNRQLAAVARLLGTTLGYRINTYTAETPLSEREELRQSI
jgi:superfamily II DNA or RNA helicase